MAISENFMAQTILILSANNTMKDCGIKELLKDANARNEDMEVTITTLRLKLFDDQNSENINSIARLPERVSSSSTVINDRIAKKMSESVSLP